MSENPAVKVAKKRAIKEDRVVTLSTGVKARLLPVAPSLIMDVQNQLRYPPVPKIHDEDSGKDFDNPDDPGYKDAIDEIDTQRGIAAIDAVMLFGVELIDGVPEDGKWIKKLQMMERRGTLSLEGYELDNEIDQEFLFKKYIAVGQDDFDLINRSVGVTEEGIEQAEDTFPGDEE